MKELLIELLRIKESMAKIKDAIQEQQKLMWPCVQNISNLDAELASLKNSYEKVWSAIESLSIEEVEKS